MSAVCVQYIGGFRMGGGRGCIYLQPALLWWASRAPLYIKALGCLACLLDPDNKHASDEGPDSTVLAHAALADKYRRCDVNVLAFFPAAQRKFLART